MDRFALPLYALQDVQPREAVVVMILSLKNSILHFVCRMEFFGFVRVWLCFFEYVYQFSI